MKQQTFLFRIILLLQCALCVTPFISSAQHISAGGFYSLAACSDNTVLAWGSNTNGELGNGTGADSNVPTEVSAADDIIAVSGGEDHSLALKNDGTVLAWG